MVTFCLWRGCRALDWWWKGHQFNSRSYTFA